MLAVANFEADLLEPTLVLADRDHILIEADGARRLRTEQHPALIIFAAVALRCEPAVGVLSDDLDARLTLGFRLGAIDELRSP